MPIPRADGRTQAKSARLRRSGLRVGVALLLLSSCTSGGAGLPTALPRGAEPTSDESAIEEQSVCVGSTVQSAGELADTLYYRHERLPDGRLVVGYYAFFSQERPWGNNWLTWLFLPALAIDLVYTRTMLVAPGLQYASYGRGDVEGFRIVYDVDEQGALSIDHAFADDASHRELRLERADLLALDAERPTLYTSTWTHQLGARNARSLDSLAYRRCYGPGSILPVHADLAREYRLDRRARPADVARARPTPRAPSAVARDDSRAYPRAR